MGGGEEMLGGAWRGGAGQGVTQTNTADTRMQGTQGDTEHRHTLQGTDSCGAGHTWRFSGSRDTQGTRGQGSEGG